MNIPNLLTIVVIVPSTQRLEMVPNKQMNALHFADMARKHACLIPLFGRPKAVLALLQPQGKGSYCPVQRNQQHVFIFCLKKKEINS
jgi:hypothetical protein